MDEFREKLLFLSDVNSELNSLEIQRDRILSKSLSERELISPVHDADFYLVILRRIYRRIEDLATYDSRVANLKGKYNTLVKKIKIRDHFEHGVNVEKMPPTDVSQIPQIKSSIASEIANIKIVTSVFINKGTALIVSGNFKWDLYGDHESFHKIIEALVLLYPFSQKLHSTSYFQKLVNYLKRWRWINKLFQGRS